MRGHVGQRVDLLVCDLRLRFGAWLADWSRGHLWVYSLLYNGSCERRGSIALRGRTYSTCLRAQDGDGAMPVVCLDQNRVQVALGHGQLAVAGIQRGRRALVQQIGFPIPGKLSAQREQILLVQFHLREIGLDALTGAKSLARKRRVVNVTGFSIADPDRMCRPAEQQCALFIADHRQHKQTEDLQSASHGGAVALQQGCVDILGSLAHGRGQRTGSLVEKSRRILDQIVIFEGGKRCIAGKHEIHDQDILLAPATGFAWRRDSQQAGQLSQFLSVDLCEWGGGLDRK